MMFRLPQIETPRSIKQSWPLAIDICVLGFVVALFYSIAVLAKYWWSAATPDVYISRSPRALPGYAFYSLVRLFAAYALSLVFAIAYGYCAAYKPRVERVLIALLDVLQSIPVLSFLPGVMLAMISLFPSRQMGVELGSILLIFTGQVWNLAFSFYSSLKAIPKELREATAVYAFSPWQRFLQLELPFGAIGLLWNSMVSIAGGWFFLMACEMFVLGKRDFRLPGLGSYLQVAASAGDVPAMIWGLSAMIAIIIVIDRLVWQPLIAWSEKFKFEQVESAGVNESAILNLLRRSQMLALARRAVRPASEKLMRRLSMKKRPRSQPVSTTPFVGRTILAIVLVLTAYAVIRTFSFLTGISENEWIITFESAGATFLRVAAALAISSLWTIPVGVAIGSNPRLASYAQPVAQVAASVPATALFPILLLALIQVGGGLGIASILLMLLGTQWYILFNVIAGAIAIPSELKEVGEVYQFNRWLRWRVIILPGIFPYLVTGLVTASGGAWNASIIAEYFHLKGHVFTTFGLGAQISSASDAGRFDVLLLSTLVMAAMVVGINRLVWRPLLRLAESRYRLGA
jgi:NitT/TauT family transport system permease protein